MTPEEIADVRKQAIVGSGVSSGPMMEVMEEEEEGLIAIPVEAGTALNEEELKCRTAESKGKLSQF